MREKSKEENSNNDYCELETKNVELENSVANTDFRKKEHLCNEINHVKQVFKEQFDSIKKTRVRTKEQSDSLIDKLNLKSAENEDLKAQIQDKVFVITSLKNDLQKLKGKEIVDIAAQTPSAYTIVPEMFKLDLKPLAPRLSRLFSGTVIFGNDHIARIMGHGDYQLGNVTISRVYYVEGLGHNLFSVGQFCDADLEVAFRKNTCFIRNLEGVDLLFGSRDTNLYTISLDDMLNSSLIYLLSKASKTKSWLWHRRLSHLNFGTLIKLAKDGLAQGILNFRKIIFQDPGGKASSILLQHPVQRDRSPNPVSQQPCIPSPRDDWDRLFQPMFDEYFTPLSNVVSPVQEVVAPRAVVLAESPVSLT
ncbi:integrase, catalytic region, zinc finger, CCHC-type containing protein [Tanacetum coccineum]|uniref:Integrase, catalytic region, zinc finger, CCHC-type containing protein n=1 Tax=Tanacetum coccineum TaxID=301880 RepID=A0ABQ5EIV3_9ASTR